MAIFARGAYATIAGIQGRDFDFSVWYPSGGPSFSTSKPPGEVLSLRDILCNVPQITLTDPASLAPTSDKRAPNTAPSIQLSTPVLGSRPMVLYRRPTVASCSAPIRAGGGPTRWSRARSQREPTRLALDPGAGRLPLRRRRHAAHDPVLAGCGRLAPQYKQGELRHRARQVDFKVRNKTGKAWCNAEVQGASIVGVTSTSCVARCGANAYVYYTGEGPFASVDGNGGRANCGVWDGRC